MYGMLVVLALCEIAGLAGLGPSLLGVFLAQVLLRPQREEIGATSALAALLVYPLYAEVAASSGEIAVIVAASDALGFAAIVVLAVQALRLHGEERAAVVD